MGFSLIGKLGLDTSDYEKALARSDVVYQQFGHKMEGFAKKQEKFLFKHLIGAFGVAAIEHTLMASVQRAGEIIENSATANKSTRVFQELEAAAAMTGRKMEDLLKMTGQLPDDVARAVQEFRNLGGAIPEHQLIFLNSIGQNLKASGGAVKNGGMSVLTGMLKPFDWVSRGAQVTWASFRSLNDLLWTRGISEDTKERWRYLRGGEDEDREVAFEEIKGRGLDTRRADLNKGLKERQKRAKEAIAKVLEAGFNKSLEAMPRDQQIKALEDDLKKSIADAGKLKGDDRREADLSIAEKRTRLAVLRASPEKFGSAAEAGRALQTFDPLNRIGGFGPGADTTVDRIDRIARATEETAQNTRQNPMSYAS